MTCAQTQWLRTSHARRRASPHRNSGEDSESNENRSETILNVPDPCCAHMSRLCTRSVHYGRCGSSEKSQGNKFSSTQPAWPGPGLGKRAVVRGHSCHKNAANTQIRLHLSHTSLSTTTSLETGVVKFGAQLAAPIHVPA